MADNEDRSLIPLPDASLANTAAGARRILAEMHAGTLEVWPTPAVALREQPAHTTGLIRTVPLTWQQQVVKKHPEIGVDGSEGNSAFVAAYHALKAANLTMGADGNPVAPAFDPTRHGMALADSVMKPIYEARIAEVDLVAIVRDGKRLYCSMMKGNRFCGKEITLEDIQAFNFRMASGLSPKQGIREEDIQAFALFYRAAKAGHSEAQFIVSRCYHWGHGVQKDEAQVLNWLHISGESGFAEAQNTLGLCYANGNGVAQDNAEAVKWFKKAGESGNASAQSWLAEYYANEWDLEQRLYWCEKSARQGNASDQRELGEFYSSGWGAENSGTNDSDTNQRVYEAWKQNHERAVFWYRKAAEQGDSDAQRSLGFCYIRGEGVRKDFDQGMHWILKAVKQERGNAFAGEGYLGMEHTLGFRYQYDEDFPRDFPSAFMWYKLSLDRHPEGLAEVRLERLIPLMTPSELEQGEAKYLTAFCSLPLGVYRKDNYESLP